MPQVNKSEALASQYLESLGLGEVVHEPDGNIPPDFLVGGHIAVEVRRLNQNHVSHVGSSAGLEELDIPLRQRLKKYFQAFAPSHAGECWYIGYGFRRPLEPWSTLKPLLDDALTKFMASPVRARSKVEITKHFEIDFMKAGVDHGSTFVLGASIDEDSGGWVMEEIEKNLKLCIAEKEAKIAAYRSRYPTWWLVLDDHIDFGMDPEDHERFRTEVMPRIQHTFARIVLLDPRNPLRAVEA
jgi:hypothetical protein